MSLLKIFDFITLNELQNRKRQDSFEELSCLFIYIVSPLQHRSGVSVFKSVSVVAELIMFLDLRFILKILKPQGKG